MSILLKKYANRRLYNTETSAYITLSEVSDLIKQGNFVEVRDAKTGEDVTAFILSQIVMEEAKNKNALLPAPLLHIIIRYGENVLSEFFQNYLEQIMQNYISYRSAVDAQYKKWLDMSFDFSGIAKKSLTQFNPLQPFLKSFFSPDDTDNTDDT